MSRSPRSSASAAALSRRSFHCACWRAPGRRCSRASLRSARHRCPRRPGAEMVVVGLVYAADRPRPDGLIRSLAGGDRGGQDNGGAPGGSPRRAETARRETLRGDAPRAEAPRSAPRSALAPAVQPVNDPVTPVAESQVAAPVLAISRFEDLIALAAQKRDLGIKAALERDVRLVRC